ncbi:MAG: CoA transferase [Syntrophobacteraceae bacterium]|jgi:crotonobetainyl-CoA:carnitine CoA-transferase CaiB-like acyl-CoA transferase|nr:CoA transferase [Syntrophobacteraceae bacterium]
MQGALDGIKVLDLSRLLPGPFCSMLMADLGADVIKVEDPGVGDYIRWWPPKIGKNSGFHVVLNRNKRSLTLNLKSPEGRDIFLKLARDADVVLEGFRPGVMKKLGLDYPVLKTVNPGIVCCAISGYGQEGDRARKAGHDINYLALNGVLSHSGRSGRPTVPGVQIADLGGGGLLAAFSILAALLARQRTGEGQFVDISMTDGAMAWNCLRWGQFIADGRTPSPGDDFLNHGYACYNVYETKDGRFMALGALEPQFWKAFCQAMEQPRWDRPDYFDPGPHQAALEAEIQAAFKDRDQAEWVEILGKYDCCCEPVLSLAEAMDDGALRARGMVVELIHESWGSYRQLGIAPRLSATPGAMRSHAPELGEHTASILLDLGYDQSRMDRLKAEGIV